MEPAVLSPVVPPVMTPVDADALEVLWWSFVLGDEIEPDYTDVEDEWD